MRDDDHSFHRSRERHCRELAERATDPDIRRRHTELAELHATQADRLASRMELETRLTGA